MPLRSAIAVNSAEQFVDGGSEELDAGGFAAGQRRFQAGDLRQKVSNPSSTRFASCVSHVGTKTWLGWARRARLLPSRLVVEHSPCRAALPIFTSCLCVSHLSSPLSKAWMAAVRSWVRVASRRVSVDSRRVTCDRRCVTFDTIRFCSDNGGSGM